MRAQWLFIAVLLAHPALAARWAINQCNPGPCQPTERCVVGRCVPTYRLAASIANRGTTVVTTAPGVTVTYQQLLTEARRAFDAWENPNVLCATKWKTFEEQDGGTFSSVVGEDALSGTDGHNNVIWLQGSDWSYGPSTLGVTTTTYLDSTIATITTIIDADVALNNNLPLADNGNGVSFDYPSILLHEAGHFMGLQHGSGVMSAELPQGTARRVLNISPDQGEVCGLYPGPPGSQGDSCTLGLMGTHDCSQGRVCEGFPGDRTTICTQDCLSMGQLCPDGYSCQPSSAGFACLPPIGIADLCKFCTSGTGCLSGQCLRDETRGTLWCSMPCSSDEQCSRNADYTCTTTPQGRFCVPKSGKPCNQCTTASDCAPGFVCNRDHTCEPSRLPDDRCEIHQVCDPCFTCVANDAQSTTASCRACCGVNGSGLGACNNCGNPVCNLDGGVPRVCTLLQNNIDKACVTTGGIETCSTQVCGINAPCKTGICVQGSCRTPCNLTHPGTCQACAPMAGTTAGAGYCACPDEFARLGEACGLVTVGNGQVQKTCVTGLVCDAVPQGKCREKCKQGSAEFSSCPDGFECKNRVNTDLCVPGLPGTIPCVACANDTCQGSLTCQVGKCYSPCNINESSSCRSCVQVDGNGNGVCSCSAEQTANTNEMCGVFSAVKGCREGTICFNNTCRTSCDPSAPTACQPYEECLLSFGEKYYCLDIGSGAGGGVGGGVGGGRPNTGGGVGGGGPLMMPGCTCQGSAGPGALLLALTVLARRRRRS